MKRIVLLFATLFLSCAASVADTVDYSTSGLFSNGSTTSTSITFGDATNNSTISFDGISPSSVTAPTWASLGSFETSSQGNGATLSGTYTFDLTISQTAPSSGSGTLDSNILDGILTETSSGLAVEFTTKTVNINGVTYSLANTLIPLVQPSTGGTSTIEAYVAPAPVSAPEPGSVALLSSGLFFVGFARRKFKLF